MLMNVFDIKANS